MHFLHFVKFYMACVWQTICIISKYKNCQTRFEYFESDRSPFYKNISRTWKYFTAKQEIALSFLTKRPLINAFLASSQNTIYLLYSHGFNSFWGISCQRTKISLQNFTGSGCKPVILRIYSSYRSVEATEFCLTTLLTNWLTQNRS